MRRRREKWNSSLAIGAVLAAALLASMAACASVSEVRTISPNTLVLDVRTPREFADWHFPGAKNIPVNVLEKQVASLGDKDRAIVVYCRSGSRSSVAKRILVDAGFTNVKNGGGLSDMRPLVTGSASVR